MKTLFRICLTFSDLKKIANSWPSALIFKSFSRSLEQFFLKIGQNNFRNKIPFSKVQMICFYFVMYIKCQNLCFWQPDQIRFMLFFSFYDCVAFEIKILFSQLLGLLLESL